MHFVLIYNPVAGRGKGMAMARHIGELLLERQHRVALMATSPNPADFRSQCMRLDPQVVAVVVGGDGTLRYFIQHMGKVAGVAFFGMGTANVLRFELGYPKQPKAFVDMLEDPATMLLRPGLMDQNTAFMMMYSIGMDSFVLANASQKLKNRIGKLAFAWSALKSMFYRAPEIAVILDDQPPVLIHFAIISRIRYYAGPYLLSREANPASDRFHVVLMKGAGLLAFTRFFLTLILGRLKNRPGLTITSAKKVIFPNIPKRVFAQMDGDPLARGYSSLTVSTQTIPFLVPKK